MTDEFVKLFTRHERRVFSYILALLADYEAADEVFQEASLVLWKRFAEFETGTNFGAWACRIAHFKVLAYRRQQRKVKYQFSDEFIESVAGARRDNDKGLEARRDALYGCLRKLRTKDVDLLKQRYAGDVTCKRLAEIMGLPVNTMYKSLGRIRRRLLECIRRTLRVEGMV